MNQPFLFDDEQLSQFLDLSEADLQKGGKVVIQYLYSVRKKLKSNPETEKWIEEINRCIKQIKSQTDLTTTQKEELILLAIERKMAWTLEEIQGDTRFPMAEVKGILKELNQRGLVRVIRRRSATGPSKQYLFKSNRIKGVEAD